MEAHGLDRGLLFFSSSKTTPNEKDGQSHTWKKRKGIKNFHELKTIENIRFDKQLGPMKIFCFNVTQRARKTSCLSLICKTKPLSETTHRLEWHSPNCVEYPMEVKNPGYSLLAYFLHCGCVT
jgi:hypothetical protein